MTDRTHPADAHDESVPAEAQSDHSELPDFPPPGPPVLVSDTGIGIERKRREAREAWENARTRQGGEEERAAMCRRWYHQNRS